MNHPNSEHGFDQTDPKLRSENELTREKLESLGVQNIDWAFGIDDEKDIDGNKIDADILWVRFKKPEGEEFADLEGVEGKLYLPKEGKRELILFTPGMPGGNAGRFEQRYARAFTDAGYSFFTVRHNGTSLTGEASGEIINSEKRRQLAVARGEHHIGGTKEGGYKQSEVVNETLTAFLALQNKFERVHLMGQSMGVAASNNTIRRLKDHPAIKRIDRVIGISGYVGKKEGEEPLDGVWDGLKMPMEDLAEYEMVYTERVDGNFVRDPKEYARQMHEVGKLNNELEVPDHIKYVLVFTPDDPLIGGPDLSKQDPAADYGPKAKHKIVIRDESMLGAPRPHSMLWIKPENLLKAVEAKYGGTHPHYFKVPRTQKGKDTPIVEKAK